MPKFITVFEGQYFNQPIPRGTKFQIHQPGTQPNEYVVLNKDRLLVKPSGKISEKPTIVVTNCEITDTNNSVAVPKKAPIKFTADEPVVTKPEPTDEQIKQWFREDFENLEEHIEDMLRGEEKGGLFICGGGGSGKTHIVESVLDRYATFTNVGGTRDKFQIIRGSLGDSPVHLYKILFEGSDANYITVFDDCDAIFFNPEMLNLLKAALATTGERRINIRSNSAQLRREDIPESFVFKGNLIFITNLDLNKMRDSNLKNHLQAMETRWKSIEVQCSSARHIVLRAKQLHEDLANDGGFFANFDLTSEQVDELFHYIESNATKFKSFSLRTFVYVADYMVRKGDRWKQVVERTLMYKDR